MNIVAPSNEYVEDWNQWLKDNTAQSCNIDEDYGLSKIAKYFGKGEAIQSYWDGAACESSGDVDSAIALYKRAFRLWPELDSCTHGGLPRGVREQAETIVDLRAGLLDVVDITAARASCVMYAPSLFSSSDLCDIEAVRKIVMARESIYENNSENRMHQHKVGTFLNNPPHNTMQREAPHILGKMIRFAAQAWEQAKWSESSLVSSSSSVHNGPLCSVLGGVPSLNIRVVEMWEYEVGGGLSDSMHYDVDSILTIVALLCDNYEGGIFRTYEADDTHLEHHMKTGDAICFVSHKYHNITPLTKGIRKSLVIELWQGGKEHTGR